MKKRIYSGKKYKKQYYSGPNEWSWSYKYEGQKSFWARTDESPEEYEIRIKSEKMTIKFKSKNYTLKELFEIKEEIRKDYVNDFENNELLDEEKLKIKKEASRWKSSQRTKRRKGKLEQEKVDRLNELGMVWNPRESEWEKKFTYFKKYGLNTDIEEWVIKQRKLFIEGKMPKENHDRLKAFKFPFKKDKNETFKITSSKIWELIDKLRKKRETFEAKEREKIKLI